MRSALQLIKHNTIQYSYVCTRGRLTLNGVTWYPFNLTAVVKDLTQINSLKTQQGRDRVPNGNSADLDLVRP